MSDGYGHVFAMEQEHGVMSINAIGKYVTDVGFPYSLPLQITTNSAGLWLDSQMGGIIRLTSGADESGDNGVIDATAPDRMSLFFGNSGQYGLFIVNDNVNLRADGDISVTGTSGYFAADTMSAGFEHSSYGACSVEQTGASLTCPFGYVSFSSGNAGLHGSGNMTISDGYSHGLNLNSSHVSLVSCGSNPVPMYLTAPSAGVFVESDDGQQYPSSWTAGTAKVNIGTKSGAIVRTYGGSPDYDIGKIIIDGGGNIKFKTVGKINMADLPTSSSGLATGDLWNDSGTLKVKT